MARDPDPRRQDLVRSKPFPQNHSSDNTPSQAPPPQSSSGTLYLVLIQFTSRALTFLGNQILLRYISPSLFGLAVQLEVLSATILYTARESLRVALQRQPSDPVGESSSTPSKASEASLAAQKIVNVAFLALCLGFCLTAIFGYAYLFSVSMEVRQSDHFTLAFQVYIIATFIELISEPYFLIIQQNMLYRARAQAETTAAVVRCVSACLTAFMMYWQRQAVSILPFAIGQLCYASSLSLLYIRTVAPIARTKEFSLTPRPIRTSPDSSELILSLFSKPLLGLTSTFYAQSLLKLYLTQGDSLVMSFLADLHAQGGFALASNYGGLASRLLFQPIEESSRSAFGRLLTRQPVPDDSSIDDVTDSNPYEKENKTAGQTMHMKLSTAPARMTDSTTRLNQSTGIEGSGGRPNSINQALTHLVTVIHGYLLLIAIPCCTILPYLLPVVIQNMIGKRWSTPETYMLLSMYSYYIPFLAVNGILDAFVTSVATPQQLRRQSMIMLLVTVFYAFVAWFLLSYLGHGSVGLVEANIANMTLRIIYSIIFIKSWLKSAMAGGNRAYLRETFKASMPSLPSAVVAIAIFISLHMLTSVGGPGKSFAGIHGLDADDVGYLISAAVVLGTIMVHTERIFLLSLVEPLIPPRIHRQLSKFAS